MPNIILFISNVKCETSTDPEVYTDEENEDFRIIINHMSKDIWLDKSYVMYKGNKNKTPFITENMWTAVLKHTMRTSIGLKVDKDLEKKASFALQIIVLSYLYHIATRYGYDLDKISISFKKVKWLVKYTLADRVSFNFIKRKEK